MSTDSGRSPIITVSVISHGQIELVQHLLADLKRWCAGGELSVEVILTLNLPEDVPFSEKDYPFSLRLAVNSRPRGFGENHNQAFAMSRGEYFCLVNPDIRLTENPFPVLLAVLSEGKTGLVAPMVLNPAGQIEDSARRFPTPLTILRKAVNCASGQDYAIGEEVLHPEWVAGMFMLIPRRIFAEMAGFDERYFLYYEDVDLCARMAMRGYIIKFCPEVRVIHEARRTSHRSVKYMKWHLASMGRFFLSRPFRFVIERRRTADFAT